MNVQVIQSQSIAIDTTSVEKLVIDFTAFHGIRFDEATIHFVDTQTICDLHAKFFDDPTTTDCISFPMDAAGEEGYLIMGDVFICPETAKDYVNTNGGDLYQEITLYTIHGLLHLIGYDDLDEEDRALMRSEEARYLEHVKVKGLWIQQSTICEEKRHQEMR